MTQFMKFLHISKNINCAIVSGKEEVKQTAHLLLGETWIKWNRN